MRAPWYFILLYIVVGYILLLMSDRYKIIKSRGLRYFLVIFVYSFFAWLVYDLVFAPK